MRMLMFGRVGGRREGYAVWCVFKAQLNYFDLLSDVNCPYRTKHGYPASKRQEASNLLERFEPVINWHYQQFGTNSPEVLLKSQHHISFNF